MVVVQNSLDVSVTDADVVLLQGQAALRGNQVGSYATAPSIAADYVAGYACSRDAVHAQMTPSRAGQQIKRMG
jgi:hypothetical protein